MTTHQFAKRLAQIAFATILLLWPGIAPAQDWRLIGITGQQGDETPDPQGGFLYPDHTLYEINLTNAAITKLFRLTFVNDSQAIGFCPLTGTLYHSAGSESYSNNPFRTGHDQGGPDISGVGYQDSQYLESINLATGVATAVFNADPCPNPDPLLPCFGLPAPRPAWVEPVERRDSTQTDASFNVRGPNEYHAARGMAWSANKGLFYIADEQGIFKLTPTGDCTFLARPAFQIDGSVNNAKAIAFVTVGALSRLLVGHRNGFGGNGYLMEIDPESGEPLGEVALTYPPGGGNPVDDFGGLLGMEQHPVTGVLYGIRKTSDNFARELVTINPVTGATALVGNLGMHIAGITFVRSPLPSSFLITSITRSGNNIALTWTGGTAPYQVQTSLTLSPESWTNLGSPTNGNSVTVPATGPIGFFRITGQPGLAPTMLRDNKESVPRAGKVRGRRPPAKR